MNLPKEERQTKTKNDNENGISQHLRVDPLKPWISNENICTDGRNGSGRKVTQIDYAKHEDTVKELDRQEKEQEYERRQTAKIW